MLLSLTPLIDHPTPCTSTAPAAAPAAALSAPTLLATLRALSHPPPTTSSSLPNSSIPSSFPSSSSSTSSSSHTAHASSSANATASAPLESLHWTPSTLTWSLGNGSVYKTFSYASEGGQPITQALFAWFPIPVPSPPLASRSSTTTAGGDSLFGPFQPAPPPPWTDTPLPLPLHPTPTLAQVAPTLERCLVVFLRDIAFVYPPQGSFVPFSFGEGGGRVGRAWALERGLLVEMEEGAWCSFGTGEVGGVMKAVGVGKGGDGNGNGNGNGNENGEKVNVEPGEKVVFVSEGREGEPKLLVSVVKGGKVKVWGYAVVKEQQEKQEGERKTQNGSENGNGTEVQVRRSSIRENGKGKGKGKEAEEHLPSSPSSSTPPILSSSTTTGKRKRSSLLGSTSLVPSSSLSVPAPLERHRPPPTQHDHHRRSSSSTSASLIHPSTSLSGGGESELLEALGESIGTSLLMKRANSAMSTASSVAIDRRGSVTRNELSVTLDRMALGMGAGVGMGIGMGMGMGAGEMDREATVGGAELEGAEERVEEESEVLVEMVWEMDVRDQGSDALDGVVVHIFNTIGTTSTLAILLPSLSTLLLFTLSLSPLGSLIVTPLSQLPCTSITPVLSTRPAILDLLILTPPDQKWNLITLNGRIDEIEPPAIPPGRKVVKLKGDKSRLVIVELDDGETFSTMMPVGEEGLARRTLETLSAVLGLEDFMMLRKAVWERRRKDRSQGEMRALVGVLDSLGSPPSSAEATPANHSDPWSTFLATSPSSDPLFSLLQSSPGPSPIPTPQGVLASPNHLQAVICALHLLAEDAKLMKDTLKDWEVLAGVVSRLCRAVGEQRWSEKYRVMGGFTGQGGSDEADSIMDDAPTSTPSLLPPSPPNLVDHLSKMLCGQATSSQWPTLSSLSSHFSLAPSNFYGPVSPLLYTTSLLTIYSHLSPSSAKPAARAQSTVLAIDALGWDLHMLERVSFGVVLPLREAIRVCQMDAPEGWTPRAYELVRRSDAARMIRGRREMPSREGAGVGMLGKAGKIVRESLNVEAEVTTVVPKATRFNEDRRLEEVTRMLQYTEPVTISAGDRTLEELTPSVQQSILNALSNRTLSLPVGFAMFHFRCRTRLASDSSHVPRLNTSARILPMASPVALIDKESRDPAIVPPPDRLEWPEFHSGVATALQVHSGARNLDSSQISFSKPAELDARHAGFLMGLGLAGELSAMVFNQAFEYLKMKHDPTSIGLLLGLAVTYVATSDPKITSLLSVHLSALHPPGSSPLNVSGITQAAALVGIGLLYLGTGRRTLADTMVRELCAIKVTSIEDPTACREGYALSAGFAFGLIMLGKGRDPSATAGEVPLLRNFRALILGESNHPLPGAPPSLDVTDVNITSSAATVSLGLMFLRTERKDVADLLEIPDTLRRLDYVRSDLLLLRTLARSIIMWKTISPSKNWVEGHIPQFMAAALTTRPASTKGMDAELDVARWNIISGACFAIGLKYAGTATAEAHATLIHYLDRLTRAAYAKASTVQAKSKRHAIRCCLSVVAISLSMVMAGTGEINVLRRLRVAHGHFSEGVTYGTHLASHMALGLLFVGSGTYTLGTSNAAVAALLLAFYPAFPPSPIENRAHLQAYRHLWVLAIESRCLQARDVDTNEPAFLPIRLRLVEDDSSIRSKQLVAPTLIPEIRMIESIQIDSPRYWAFTLHLASNPQHLASFLQSTTLYVKRRTGHLNYAQDPKGIRSIFTRSKSETGSSVFDFGETSRTLAPSAMGLRDFVSAFSDDPESVAAVKYLCHSPSSNAPASAFEAFSASVLLECLTRDKRDTIGTYHAMRQAFYQLSSLSPLAQLELEQLNFILDFYAKGSLKTLFGKAKGKSSSTNSSTLREALIQTSFLLHVSQNLDEHRRNLLEDPKVNQAVREYLATSMWPSDQSLAKGLALCLASHHAPEGVDLRKLMQKMRETRVALQGREEEEVRVLLKLVLLGVAKGVGDSGRRVWTTQLGDLMVEVSRMQ